MKQGDGNNAPGAISFGALSDRLHEQLGWAERRCKFPQRLADAVTLLAVHQMASESETRRIRLRILKRLHWMHKNPGR